MADINDVLTPFPSLLTEEEAKHAQETGEMFIVLPHIDLSTCRVEDYAYPGSKPAEVTEYTSKGRRALTQKEIKEMLRQNFSLETLR